jgi:hypothetical protein
MHRFRFALSDIKSVREVGMVQSDTFDDAMSAVTERFAVTAGDSLEIGVYGFPPARYMYVQLMEDSSAWRPVGQKAA